MEAGTEEKKKNRATLHDASVLLQLVIPSISEDFLNLVWSVK